jgi:hypothetical protein
LKIEKAPEGAALSGPDGLAGLGPWVDTYGYSYFAPTGLWHTAIGAGDMGQRKFEGNRFGKRAILAIFALKYVRLERGLLD